MEIIRVTDGDYRQYEELLLQRDALEKEAMEYRLEYTREFGELAADVFREKLECISLKKAIAFCRMARNHGEEPDRAALEEYLSRQMAAYHAQLCGMQARNRAAAGGKTISAYQADQVRRLYRRLAKLLHPDISPLTEHNRSLQDLFQRVMEAYQCNNLRRLQELEVLVQKALEDLGADHAEIVIENIEKKIAELEREIQAILTTEPYLFKDLLADALAVLEKKQELQKELEEYKKYRRELQDVFSALIEK